MRTSISLRDTICVYVVAVIAIQLIFGNVNEVFFKAPLNIAVLLLWLLLLAYFRSTDIVRNLSEKKAAVISIIFIIVCSLVVGLTPQLTPNQAAAKEGFISSLGVYNFTQSWFMIGSILLIITNLWLIILKRISLNSIGFLLNHFGLLLVLVSALFGSADIEKLRMRLNKDSESSSIAYNANGGHSPLNFNILLHNFVVKLYPNGDPMQYTATIVAKTENGLPQSMDIEVNHPAKYKGYDIYLISYGEDYCIIELQKQPWKYPLATGIVIMLVGAIATFMRKKDYPLIKTAKL